MVAMESSGLMKPTACLQSRFLEALGEHNTITAGGGGEGAGSAAGEEAALRRELQNHLQLEMAQRERDSLHDAIRSKDAEIERLRRLAYGLEVIDVEAGVTRIVVEEAGLRASQPWKRMRKEQAARGRVIGALQEQLVKVKKEHVGERVARHSELRTSVDVNKYLHTHTHTHTHIGLWTVEWYNSGARDHPQGPETHTGGWTPVRPEVITRAVPVSLLQCRQGRTRGFGFVYAHAASGDVVVFLLLLYRSFSKMFLNTSDRAIRLRLILGDSSAFYY